MTYQGLFWNLPPVPPEPNLTFAVSAMAMASTASSRQAPVSAAPHRTSDVPSCGHHITYMLRNINENQVAATHSTMDESHKQNVEPKN